MAFFTKKTLSSIIRKKGNNLELWNIWGWAAHIPKQRTYREIYWPWRNFSHWIIFGEKNSFFEKKLCRGWFWRRDWARTFKLGGMITYTQGLGLLKKNSWLSDFCENYGRFTIIGLYHFWNKYSLKKRWPLYHVSSCTCNIYVN